MSGEQRGRNPYGGSQDPVRERIQRRIRLHRETRHVGMEDRKPKPVTLTAVGDKCPAHLDQPVLCPVCLDDADRMWSDR